MNKLDKNIFIYALILLVMLCAVSTVSAEDSLNENLTATDSEVVIDDDINDALSVQANKGELSDQGDTITVDAGGSGDYTTISDAVSAANGGETILIKNGEYTQTAALDFTKTLNIVGESKTGVVIKTSGNIALLNTAAGVSGVTLSYDNWWGSNSSPKDYVSDGVTLKPSKNPYYGKYYLKAGKKVTLKVNGKTYSGKINGNGVVKFKIKITKKGKYTPKITFKGDKTYNAASKSIKITIK